MEELERKIPQQEYNTWIKPLQIEEKPGLFRILAPNDFVYDALEEKYLIRIKEFLAASGYDKGEVILEVGSLEQEGEKDNLKISDKVPLLRQSGLQEFTFDSFVGGKSNQLARAAAIQVAESPGKAYNPLFISGGVGLGKTHLMHAVGNLINSSNKTSRVVYVHSETFVSDMVKALQHNKISEFKRFYRSVDALLIDDIQFFCQEGAVPGRVFSYF